MKEIDLTSFQPLVRKQGEDLFIYDPNRKKYLFLTPEEWVRQAFIDFLHREYNYPLSLIAIESGLKYGQRAKRSDILVLDREGQSFLLVECKSLRVNIDQSTFHQASTYNSIIQAPYLVITNGAFYQAYHLDKQEKAYRELSEIPPFPTS
ncbi:MAG: type I restriction enzyme HsdR N-terminal domain-containing protein [Bacteroidota bacterium]